MTDLLSELRRAEGETSINAACRLCTLIQTTEDPETREALMRASAGTIGRDKLVAILKNAETGIGKRTIVRHRQEEHTP